jgi:hypothetical protein
MATTASKTDPALWQTVKAAVTRGAKGGRPGQWSARKAQLATAEYKKAGGGYAGPKTDDNRLSQWTREEWGTKSGAKSKDSGERYLPKKARQILTEGEYRRTTTKKRADTAKGKQFSSQPEDVARKVAPTRTTGKAGARGLSALTRAELLEKAAKTGIVGRSRMRKDDLLAALRQAA